MRKGEDVKREESRDRAKDKRCHISHRILIKLFKIEINIITRCVFRNIFNNYLKVLRNILSRSDCRLTRLNMTGNALMDSGLQILCSGIEVSTYVHKCFNFTVQ